MITVNGFQLSNDQAANHFSFVRKFPDGQSVRYLPMGSVIARVREVYWNGIFWETWVKIEVWDEDTQEFLQWHSLPAFLFMRQENDRCAQEEDNANQESANT